jgi:opacity protein-like surface antigen
LAILYFLKGSKMIAKKIAIGVAALALTAAAQAQSNEQYLEVGYTMLDVKASADGITLESSPTLLRFIAGTEIVDGLAIEAMYGTSAGGDDISANGLNLSSLVSTELKVKNVFGFYLKPTMSVNDNLNIFGRLGYTKAKYSISIAQVGLSGSESSVSYGVGANYKLSKAVKLTADYMSYVSDDADTDGITVGLRFDF